jgi:hypothetical protein
LDKLEDEIDKKKEEEGSEKIVYAVLNAIEKLKNYYLYTYGLIYTVSTSRFNNNYYYFN